MIKHKNDKVFYSAINRLTANNDFKLFIDWLSTNLDEQDIKNRKLEDTPLYRGQGASNTLADILQNVEDANKVVQQLNR